MSIFQEEYFTHYVCQAVVTSSGELTIYYRFGSDTAVSVNNMGIRQSHSVVAGCVSPQDFPIFGFQMKGILSRCRLQDFNEMLFWGNLTP